MDTRKAVNALGALAHEKRLAIFRLLMRTGPGGLPAGAVAGILGIHAATLSHHLGLLARADLLVSRRSQRQVIYAIRADGLGDLIAFLADGGGTPPPSPTRGEKPRVKVRAGIG